MAVFTHAHSGVGVSPARSTATVRRDALPSTGERVRDAVVIVFGTLGVVVVAWLLIAWTLHLSVIVFVTGSMSPTMPTGSAAVVQTVPAADLHVGDVVTVTGASSGRPVTHRIVQIDPVSTRGTARALTLKGDANSIVDSQPYVIDQAERVLVAVPELGWFVIWTKSPLVMVAASTLIAAAVAWGLWPSSKTRARERTADPKGTTS